MFEKQRKCYVIFEHPVKVHNKKKEKLQTPFTCLFLQKRSTQFHEYTYVTTVTRANVKSTIILLEPET